MVVLCFGRLIVGFVLFVLVLDQGMNVASQEQEQDQLDKILQSTYNKMPWSIAPQTKWNGYSFKYTRNEEVVTFLLSGPYKQGWLGIGFSKTGGMVGSSSMVGWAESEGNGTIKQYLLSGYSPAMIVPDEGDLQLTNVAPISVLHQGTLYMAFQLNLTTTNMTQKVILASAAVTPEYEKIKTECIGIECRTVQFSLNQYIYPIHRVSFTKYYTTTYCT
ncbi:hypothetical protein Dimus_031563 [Dionaea muscipula]